MAMISSFPRLTCPSFSTNRRNQIFSVSNSGRSSIMIRDLNKRKICKLVYASAQKSENEVTVESKTNTILTAYIEMCLDIIVRMLALVEEEEEIILPKIIPGLITMRACLCTEQYKVETLLDSVKWDDKGLAVAIAQNVDTGDVLMQGFANREALATTISSRKATFYSRSRSSLWTKGETSMNFIHIHDVYFDCDRDSIIYLGKPDGPTCHTGSETCYYLSVNDSLKHPEQVESSSLARTTLYSLEHTISQRNAETEATKDGKLSWTKKLLLDKKLLCSKIREEADELCRTLEDNEDKSRTASEMADVLYHSMVLLAVKDVKVEEVLEVLRQRFAKSGIEEKKSRKQIDKPE